MEREGHWLVAGELLPGVLDLNGLEALVTMEEATEAGEVTGQTIAVEVLERCDTPVDFIQRHNPIAP